MKQYSRKGIYAVLFIILLLALIAVRSQAGASQVNNSGSERANGSSNEGVIESVKLVGLFQQGDPPRVDPQLIRELKKNARGNVSISTQKSTLYASFVRVDKDGDLHPGNSSNTPRGKANGFFAQYGGLFGIKNANAELVERGSFTDSSGKTHVSYQQVYRGLPVFAAVLQAHVDAQNDLSAMNGVFIPNINVDTSPAFSAGEATERAVAEVLANPPQNELTGKVMELSADDLSAVAPTLYVYRDGLIQGIEGPNLLVYEVEVTKGSSVRELVYIDAHTGKIVNRISLVHDSLFRRLFEQNTSTQVWQEGDPFPGALNQDQQNIVNFSGD